MVSIYNQQTKSNTFTIYNEDEEMISLYVHEKRKKLLYREGAINQLFGIKNYVDLFVSLKEDYSN